MGVDKYGGIILCKVKQHSEDKLDEYTEYVRFKKKTVFRARKRNFKLILKYENIKQPVYIFQNIYISRKCRN